MLVTDSQLPSDYAAWLTQLKARIAGAQQRATVVVNTELVLLYWDIGQAILDKQQAEGWGSKVVERLAHDLKTAFPAMKGFSRSNMLYMRAFAEAWSDRTIVQQLAGQLPWFHNVLLLTKVKDHAVRTWYVHAAIEHGWSRAILEMQIETDLHAREGKAVSNFAQRLPRPQSDLANATLKDPYIFDFLGLGKEAQERAIEDALVDHIVRFLLELGAGFAFIGRQVPLEVGGDDFFVDLLFYHVKLRCYVVIELKTTAFKPEYAGQLNFYLSAVDDILKHEHDQPTIGLLLCKSHNRVVAEYALRDIAKPIGIAEYKLMRAIPDNLATNLPTIEEIEAELQNPSPDDTADSIE